jgi:hypothetical protein
MKTKEVKITSVKGRVLDSHEKPRYNLTESFYRRREANIEEQEISDAKYESMFMRGR